VISRRLTLALTLACAACGPRTTAPPAGPAPAPASARGAAPLYAWVQHATGEQWSVRQIVPPGAACPAGTLVRAEPSRAFPVRVCEARLPLGTASVDIGRHTYRRPAAAPARMAVLGDTGCRIKRAQVQNCDDPQAWPFPRVIASIHGARPGLVLHVGDYWYREFCAADQPGCARGGPLGDNWAAWDADFFRPAAPLLASAPWIFLRGNHENCGRGGEGWFRFLDPGERPAAAESYCQRFTPPYTVRLSWVDLLVMDSGCAAEGTRCTEELEGTWAEYRREVAAVAAMAGSRPAWLVTHTPLWAAVPFSGADSTGTRSLQEAVARLDGGRLPYAIQLAVAGHVHLFQALDWGGVRLPQLIVGNSGTALDPALTTRQEGRVLNGVAVRAFSGFSGFGYALASPSAGGGWTLDVRGADGRALTRCRAASLRLTCEAR
jgi:hypothetical protein